MTRRALLTLCALVAASALATPVFSQCACEGSNAQEFLAQLAQASTPLAVPVQSAEQSPGSPWEAPWGAGANADRPPTRPRERWLGSWPRQAPRTYRGANLEYVLMPIGGIGTGTIWLDGQGRLAVWQVFNNYDERPVRDTFFAIRAEAEGSEPVVRCLQTVGRPAFAPMQSLEYEGGYPIARLRFSDPALPVRVTLEAYNPMIPTDAANSALPCAIFRVTASNDSDRPVSTSVLASLANALPPLDRAGFAAPGAVPAFAFDERGYHGVFIHPGAHGLAPGQFRVREIYGRALPEPPILWVDGLSRPDGSVEDRARFEERIGQLAQAMREGSPVVISGIGADFPRLLQRVQEEERALGMEVFEDFEGGSYEGWTVTGDAFGKAPAGGTTGGQQPGSGFLGGGLVNTFQPNDQPRGKAVSKPFTIRKPWIGFLIGGGAHANQTCINLRIGDEIVRTATGKNDEKLEPAWWDARDLQGREAVFEIVDANSGGWGHINIDHIFFSNTRSDEVLRQDRAYPLLTGALGWLSDAATTAQAAAITPQPGLPSADKLQAWRPTECMSVDPERAAESGFQPIATDASGKAVVLSGKLGKAPAVVCLAAQPPDDWVKAMLETARGVPMGQAEWLVPASPDYGSMALASPDPEAAAGLWVEGRLMVHDFASAGAVRRPQIAAGNAAVAVPFKLAPGEARTATFVITWHFPNVSRLGGHEGNLYSRRFGDAGQVARYVCENADALWERTDLYQRTLYESNLPESWLDAMTSQSVIFRGPTTWWAEDGYFGGFEGSYSCCPLNCTHVWNYAQSHARLFPEIGRNMRQSDLLVYMRDTGETSHRQHGPHGAFIDGQCAAIVEVLREHQMSADDRFLRSVWPALQKAMDWLIERIDADRDGVPSGQQPNTYDCNVSGANTFIGSQYLAALAAAEQLALDMDEPEVAETWKAVREAGMRNQNEFLWNGEYYIQKPDAKPLHDYGPGCHSDQLLGQWWAHQLGLGHLYPPDRVRSALRAIVCNNFRESFVGVEQRPRRYVLDDESGLLMCTWPKGGRPDPFIIYADEVWTGIEYSTAGLLISEGMIEEADRIVSAARSRYDGRRRDGLNSGPGGNPFNELECGKFYARAMSSWGLLIAAQGLVLDGPAGIIGLKPRWQPEDHRSFFTAPEGWGLFVQKRDGNRQTERIELRHGKLRVSRLLFELPAEAGEPSGAVTVSGVTVPCEVKRDGRQVMLELGEAQIVAEPGVLEVELGW